VFVLKHFIHFIIFVAILFGLTNDVVFAEGVSLSVKGGYFYYKEPQANVDYSGMVSGLQGGYSKVFSKYAVKVRSEYMSGQLTYDGSLNVHEVIGDSIITSPGQKQPISYHADLWYSDSTLSLGRPFKKGGRVITPYIGLGYRYLNSPDNTDIISDYEREVAYLYLPLICEIEKNMTHKRSWGISGEVDILLNGSVKAHISDASAEYNDLSFTQSFGGGLKLAGYYRRTISDFELSITPFCDLWLVGDSDTDVLMYNGNKILGSAADGDTSNYREPGNITLTAGLAVKIIF
jgi:hypothetical protein